MSTATPTRKFTPEELLAMPDGDQYELVDGELVERNVGWKASYIAARLVHLLFAACVRSQAGWVVGGDGSYQCFPDSPDKVRRPDASYIRLQRLPAGFEPEGHCRVTPDIVVEVISPNDSYYEVEKKIEEYLAAGVLLVWVVNPPTRSVRVHRVDGTVSMLTDQQELTGEDVLPDFRCSIAESFTTPDGSLLTTEAWI